MGKGSAFSTAASNDVDGTGPKQTTLESSGSLDSNNSTSRVFGRKAAQEANEKLTVKEKQKAEKNAAGPSIESGKKKEKATEERWSRCCGRCWGRRRIRRRTKRNRMAM